MKRTRKKMWGLLLCLLLAVVVIVSACGGNGETEPENNGSGETNGTEAETNGGQGGSVSMLNAYFSNTAPEDNGEVVSSVEEISKTDLDITWVPQNTYDERLNVTLSSDEMPQVLMVEDPFHTSILNGVRSGMFWELDPYLDEFPNLANFDQQVIDNLKIDGESYVIPRPRPFVRNGLIVREDWLNELGMELPTTIDEFYDMLVAFAENDPDGNGEDDTYGIMFYEGAIPRDMFSWFGSPNNWEVKNGEFIKDVETPEHMEALKFLRQLYEEGLVNPDFPIVERNEARQDMYNDNVGVSIEALDAVVPFYYFQMEETGNYYDLTAGSPIEGKSYATAGHYGGALIPRTSVETEEELKEVLRYFDTQLSEEATEQFTELVTENEERPAGEQFNIDDMKNLIVNDAAMYPPGDSELNQMLTSRMEEHAEVGVADPSEGLVSPTEMEQGQQLNTLLEDAEIQFILGEIDEAGFESAVEDWKARGGADVAQELAELYEQREQS